MFNIIDTLRNYFARELDLLSDYLSSKATLHFNVNYWRPCLLVSCECKSRNISSSQCSVYDVVILMFFRQHHMLKHLYVAVDSPKWRRMSLK